MSEQILDDGLFPESEAFDGDPVRPDKVTPTPLSIVASLTRRDREARVRHLVAQAHEIYAEAISTYARGREVVASCLLFSGGNDSTTLAHLFRQTATHAIHANTTIGIEKTRQYVRDTCASWGLPLIEVKADHTYRELVLGMVKTKRTGDDIWPGGFPGPGAHSLVYTRLKERALDKARHELGIANSRTTCAVFIAGRRRQESERRADIPLYEDDGSVIWSSPIALWTKLDMMTYRIMEGDVPVNETAQLIHMSGECLCGAYAKPGELDEIGYWFPEVKAEIEALQDEVRALGIPEPFATWGHGQGKPSKTGRLCSSCSVRYDVALPLDGAA